MRPPDSGEPFLVNGIAYQHTLQLYLILESVMSASFLLRKDFREEIINQP
jgi:hypothetical protein